MPAGDARTNIDTERLLQWAIGRCLADLIVEAAENPNLGWEARGYSADGVATIINRGVLGTVIDGRGSSRADLPLSPDAEHVYRLVRECLDPTTRTLVRDCARRGTRPDPCPFPRLEIRPVLVKNRGRRHGQVREYRTPRAGSYCRFDVIDRLEELEQFRDLYRWWWDGLMEIERALLIDQSLERWRVVPCRISPEPWKD